MAGTKDFTLVSVKGHNYKIGYVAADKGAVIIRKITAAGGTDKESAIKAMMGGMSIDNELFMQRELLSVVSFERLLDDKQVFMPVFADGQIKDPDISTDAVAVWTLEQLSFNQNIAPFFSESGQADVMKALQQATL
jgi:hypothetical protein